ncbi:MAG: archease [Thermoleophilia bacterium]|nr:archease [Thermoleophilia bacterium]
MTPWETFEHQADVGLVVHAPDGASLFVEAGLALLSLLCDPDAVRERASYDIAVSAPDEEELLVAWLNELLFLFEGRGVVWRRIELRTWSPTALRATLHGEPVDPGRHAIAGGVKAATYHGLAVVSDPSGWQARVILDV